jgi:hypothetical protein
MRILQFILIFLLPLSLLAQKVESEISDTISFNSSKYLTYELKINNYSASDPAKVFIVDSKDFDTIKRIIPKYYFAKKQEYNEYYLLGVPELANNMDVTQVTIQFLNHIDSLRLLRHRSTFRRTYIWDNTNRKIVYQSEYKELSKIDNLFYLKSISDICKYMSCPNPKF